MEIVERYLQAVKFWLPKEQKDDILAEISVDLQSQIEDRESALGRPLVQAEIEEILKRRGRPSLVASSFRPQRSLIGPVLYPIYLFCLKIAFLFYLIPWGVVSLTILIVRPTFHAGQVPAYFRVLAQVAGHLWTMAFIAAGTVTLIFAILERVQEKSHWLENWDPRKLPPMRKASQNRRTNAAFELAILLLGITWWATNMDTTVISFGETLRITLRQEWIWFFWGYLVQLALSTATAAYSVYRPAFALPHAAIRLFNSVFGCVLFCWLLRADILVSITAPGVTPQRAIEIVDSINQWLVIGFPLGVVTGVVIATIEITKIVMNMRQRRSAA